MSLNPARRARQIFADFARNPLVCELFIFLTFCLFTSLLTWPYVGHLRNAVADPGDPYLVSWILWWDYHQTFTDPLNLFHSNIFYPLRYTLAFSEHCYGLALLYFPLFALGYTPLTVHAVALFFAFSLCGYGAFRLARTLTGSFGVAWVAGIIFAFVPYRFHLLSHLPYLFSAWIPLLFEALVLFARLRSWKRAVWLGLAFFMTGLTTISWFTLSLVPLALATAILLTRYRLWHESEFWGRAAATLGIASVALLPFMLPYYLVSRLYGFKRSIEEVKANSAWPIHWLSVEPRNKLWRGLGENLPDAWRFKLFPGLLPLLFSFVAILFVEPLKSRSTFTNESHEKDQWKRRLDIAIFVVIVLSIVAIGFEGTPAFGGLFNYVRSQAALTLLVVAIIARLCVFYPPLLQRGDNANLIQTLRSERRGDAFWIGILLTIVGFFYSLGWNFFFYRICYDLIPVFRSLRVPTRGAMFAYLGLALLAGLGVQRIVEISGRKRWAQPWMVYTAGCLLLLGELNGAPLKFMLGEAYPDSVTLRLKQTPMRGGIVMLPAGADFNHRYMLRSADHQKPLIVGTSGFNSHYESEIEGASRAGAIAPQFMDLLERIPTSYVVVENSSIVPDRRVDYETFLSRGLASGRLRFVNRFDEGTDLYAVTKTEPSAQTEAAVPFQLSVRNWAEQIQDNPVNILGQHKNWSQTLYRVHVAAFATMPRYAEFLREALVLSRGVLLGIDQREESQQLEDNLNQVAQEISRRDAFKRKYKGLNDAQFVEQVLANTGLGADTALRDSLVAELASTETTRGGVLLKVAHDPRFAESEADRSLVLLHFFGYFRRNPDDPPDGNLRGFNYWMAEVKKHGGSDLASAFAKSAEYTAHSGNSVHP